MGDTALLRAPHVPPFTRAIVIVLDGVGIGSLPDADRYGDAGSNTLGNVAARTPLRIPTLRSLGLGRLVPLGEAAGNHIGNRAARPLGATGRMAEVSAGKDSVTGHWELFGVVLDRPFPVFPDGFPAEVVGRYSREVGRAILCNAPYSGTAVIDAFGEQHMASGALILYTSADSVCQIAAHESIVPVPELYRCCQVAYDIFCQGLGVGRVIARPFVGRPGAFRRTANRRDFALPPPGETLLDRLGAAGHPTTGIGKIEDLFGGRGIGTAVHTSNDDEGLTALLASMTTVPDGGFVVANLVDSDTVFGHRNDVEGFAANLERIDNRLAEVLLHLRPSDLLVVTADHGNDPTTPSTDHSREYVPVIAAGRHVVPGVDLGTRTSFADLGQTLAELYGVPPLARGTSFLQEMTTT